MRNYTKPIEDSITLVIIKFKIKKISETYLTKLSYFNSTVSINHVNYRIRYQLLHFRLNLNCLCQNGIIIIILS